MALQRAAVAASGMALAAQLVTGEPRLVTPPLRLLPAAVAAGLHLRRRSTDFVCIDDGHIVMVL